METGTMEFGKVELSKRAKMDWQSILFLSTKKRNEALNTIFSMCLQDNPKLQEIICNTYMLYSRR